MSIKGIVLAFVSVLAGATLIASGGYRAGLHSAAALRQENKELKQQNSQLEEDKKALTLDYNSLEDRYDKLIKENNGLKEYKNISVSAIQEFVYDPVFQFSTDDPK